MLRSVREMTGYTVRATDGEIGRVMDFYFEDERWTVRYVVVNTGDAAAGAPASRGTVLISPMAVTNPDFDAKRFDVALTREQVLNGPDLGDRPVSREWEEQFATYHSLPRYWGGTGLWGAFANAVDAAAAPLAGFPVLPAQVSGTADGSPVMPDTPSDVDAGAPVESHLRSAKEVMGYGVEASDGGAGAIEDLLVDDRSWQVLHFVVDTTRWWPGGEVVVPADTAQQVDWPAQRISFDLTREEIKRRAEFRPAGQTGDRRGPA